ncbi:MAG: NADH-quinone oxidoreductase subunit N [Actinomycetota bacterium]|nr:NADH-quinone oxidoreductase subunit N [Actinomycetota bacterium]
MPEGLSLVAIAPEAVLVAGVLAVLVAEVTLSPAPASRLRLLGGVTAAALLGALGTTIWQWAEGSGRGEGLFYSGMVVLDGFGALARLVLILLAALALGAAWPLVEQLGRRGAEFLALVLVSLTGMILMAASANLLMLFLALEVASISLYVLAGMGRVQVEGDEAALKYFLLGSFASAVFLYGVALTYGATGTLSLYELGGLLAERVITAPGVFLAGMALLMVGLAFKVSAAPFHMWSPDVYQGAPAGAVSFMAAGAKVAGFAALSRVLVVGLGSQRADWAPAVAVLAAISLLVGTALAITQSDIRRMLAYSSIAHAGFILTGLVAGEEGLTGVWFYLATYGVQLIGAFAAVAVVAGPAAGRSALADYGGLSERSPFVAGVLSLMMVAMGGIPLTTGFVGKVGVFSAALEAGYLWLVVLGLLASVAGLFFYLRVIVLMYMQAPALAEAPGTAPARPQAAGLVRLVLTTTVAITLAFGIFPGPLLELIGSALPL